MAYEINYDDKRFQQVETEKNQALTDLENTYSGMINDSDKYYQAQIDASKRWTETQQKNQQEQTDFAIEKINQQKEQAEKDYIKEQSGAYVDWKKQSNQYGANAEQLATQGLLGSGYAESSQVSMYNTYQNRYATARESYQRAILNYDNGIKDAILQNNVQKAEIAYKGLQAQLELSLQGFQYKNQLLLDKLNKKNETEDRYYSRYQDVLQQINTENALQEEIRQYNESMSFQKEQFAWQKAQASKSSGGSSRSSGGSGGGSGGNSGGVYSNKTGDNAVNTEYYSGSVNKDGARYGTYDGNQPKGIKGHGAVSATTGTVEVEQKNLSGQVKTTEKTVYQTSDGSKWYWSDTGNKYQRLTQGGTGNSKTIAATK